MGPSWSYATQHALPGLRCRLGKSFICKGDVMRLIKLVSLAAYCGRRFVPEECRLKGISNSAGHLVIFSLVLLMSSEACADNPASTAPPQVNLLYGNHKT